MLRFFHNFIEGNYTSLIDAPTRVTQTSKTCLDHIYVNFNENFFVGVLQASTNDHYATFCCMPIWLERDNIYSKQTFRNHSEENILDLRRELSSTLSNFQIFSEFGINDKFKFFDSLIQKAYFKHCSKKT